jgi:hypothetical protein
MRAGDHAHIDLDYGAAYGLELAELQRAQQLGLQRRSTKGALRRSLPVCSSEAKSSLPLPVSPNTSTGTLRDASLSASPAAISFCVPGHDDHAFLEQER